MSWGVPVLGIQAANLIRRRAGNKRAILRRQNAEVPKTIKLSAPLLAGASSLTAVTTGTQALAGKVVEGATFTVVGITGTFTVLADAKPVAGVVTITFDPPIPVGQSAATNALLTFTRQYKEYSYPVLNRQVSAEDSARIDAGFQMRALPFEPLLHAPDNGDFLDGILIKEVRTVDADDSIAYYKCFVPVKP